MTYADYIAYHKQGDAGVEERMIASLCSYYHLSEWDDGNGNFVKDADGNLIYIYHKERTL